MMREKLQKIQVKRLVILNLPYFFIFYVADKGSWLYRHCLGESMVQRLGVMLVNFRLAFLSWLPSIALQDLTVGVLVASALKLVVYYRSKNAKKFRQGVEYGSARWGNRKDIEPFMDPVFENNVILTETERLTMNSKKGNGFRDLNTYAQGCNGYLSAENRIKYLEMQLAYKDQEIEFLKKLYL